MCNVPARRSVCWRQFASDTRLVYLIDGDGGDENMKSYPSKTRTSRSPVSCAIYALPGRVGRGCHQAQPHLFGGLSRSYVRTTHRSKVRLQCLLTLHGTLYDCRRRRPAFEKVLDGSVERLYTLKQEMVQAGVLAVTGIEMPVSQATLPGWRRRDTYATGASAKPGAVEST